VGGLVRSLIAPSAGIPGGIGPARHTDDGDAEELGGDAAEGGDVVGHSARPDRAMTLMDLSDHPLDLVGRWQDTG
jgi:hypothetical protein